MPRVGLLVLAVAAVLGAAAPSPAQTTVAQLFGRTVAAVRFDVEGRIDTSPALMALVDVKVGSPLRQDEIRSSLARLASVGRFENVSVDATDVGDGVDVVFRIVPRHPLTGIDVADGETGLAPRTLRARVLQRYGGIPTTVRIEAIEAAARQVLREEGYLGAVVSSSLELAHDPEAATLVLQVKAGPLSRVRRVEVVSTILPASEIVDRTQTHVGQPYRERVIATALTRIEDELRSRGYYEAEATAEPAVTAEGVDLTITVTEGARVELRVEPRDAMPDGDVDDFIPIRREGSADQDLLEDSRIRIENALKDDGYWRASAPFTRSLQDDGARLVVTFTISRGPRYFVHQIDFPSTLTLPVDQLRSLVAVAPGDVFSQAAFERGMQQVISEYQRRGYYDAEAAPEYEPVSDRATATDAWVVLHPNIAEGPQGRISAVSIAFSGTNRVPEPELRRALRSQPGQPYVAYDAATDRDALTMLYRSHGFLAVQLEVQPSFSNQGRDVTLNITVTEGPQVLIGEISVIGNERVSERAILEELGLTVGEPLGDQSLADARQRLANMGVFRRATVSTEDLISGEAQARVLVSVVESPATSIGFGAGIEGETRTETVNDQAESRFELSPRGSFEIGRRNLGGRNRAVNLFSRVNLRPRSEANFFEYRVTTTYSEQRAFRSDSTLLFGLTSEQAARASFNFVRRTVNAELLRRVRSRVSLSGRYALDFTRLFDEKFGEDETPDIDRLFPQLRLSTLSAGLTWDRRDSPLVPTRGTFATADVEVAARAIGSEVGYAKTVLQVSGFHALDPVARTVLAVRGQVGLARGFERTVPDVDAVGNPIVDEIGNPVTRVVRDVPISKRFFAGGSTTVRGFPVDRLGVPVDDTTPVDNVGVLNPNGLSLGGNAVVLLNAELRRIVGSVLNRSLALVGFVDGGNVFADVAGLDLSRLRATYGLGVRYDSPVGPLRFDIGIKTERLLVGTQRESGWEYHLSIGEAF